jgi:hypothetical protein
VFAKVQTTKVWDTVVPREPGDDPNIVTRIHARVIKNLWVTILPVKYTKMQMNNEKKIVIMVAMKYLRKAVGN